jgi:N1-aminopropylagmatine ureohydrolase
MSPATRPPLPVFGGVEPKDSALETARVVMLPVPYDRTASYQKGTADGPRALLEASTHMELYDDELGVEPYTIGVHTAAPVSGNEDPPEVMAGKVQDAVAHYLDLGKMPVVLGGEHSVSIGAIRAYEKVHPHLSVLQFDAHGDLRDTFEGSPYNHACIMRRFAGRLPTLQVGIRSMSREEAEFIREKRLMVIPAWEFVRGPESALRAVDRLTDEIYLTFDVDYFDPAILPGTGTPEPGGPGWYETLAFIREVCRRKKVVGFDVNELRPLEGDKASDFLVAKLVYKILAYRFFAEGRRPD